MGISADFAEAVLFVEPLGRNLEDGGVQMQGLIAERARTGFELIQNELAVRGTLILRMDSHAFDRGAIWTGALQSAHRHQPAIAFTNQKFPPILEIHFLDRIDIIIPGTTPQIGPGLLNNKHMEMFDRFLVGGSVATQCKHEAFPLLSQVEGVAGAFMHYQLSLTWGDGRVNLPSRCSSLAFTPLRFFGAHLNPGVIRCLSSGSTRDNGAGGGRNNRCSAGDPIDASPAVAHPDNAWDDIIRHVSSGLELAALVGNDNWGIARDVSFLRIPGMNPELRPRVGFSKRWERLAFIKERMKGREGTSLTETQRILCLSWSGIGWQGREPGLAGTLPPG